jgi:hypothetical protein
MQLRILPLLTLIIFSVVWSFAFSVPTTLAQGFEDDYGDMD